MSEHITTKSGIYAVTLNNSVPISAQADDPRSRDRAIKVNKNNLKVGKARNLAARRNNYYKTFAMENVNFSVITCCDEINDLEKSIKKELYEFRMNNPSTD